MKKFLRSLVAMTACAAMVAACNDTSDPTPKPVDEEQKNYYAFDGGEQVEVNSVIADEADGIVYLFFSAQSGLATVSDIYNADDCTEVVFPASAIGGEIDLAKLTEEDVTYIISMLPQFGEQYGFSVDGYDETISEGKLTPSLKDNTLTVKCEFTTLTGIGFVAQVSCPFGGQDTPGPSGNYYEYAGKTVELNSIYAFGVEEDGETYFGFYAAPAKGMDFEEIMMSEHMLGFMVDATSMYDDAIMDMETGVATFDVTNLPEGCELQMMLVNSGEDLMVGVPDDSVSEGTITVYFTEDAGGYVFNFAGNIVLKDGNVLKMSCVAPLVMDSGEETLGELEYVVDSRGIAESGNFRSAFYHQSTWDEGMTFTYSVSEVHHYNDLGNNAFVEIYVGSDELLNGESFNVATTNLPFSFKIEYLDRENGTTVPVVIDNDNRAGASGYITFTQNYDTGLYNAYFNLFLNDGDITVNGYFKGEMQPRNTVYAKNEGTVAMLRSATLDTTGNPCVLYLSSKRGTAGPDQYDIKCEVPAGEWRYDYFMAFGGNSSAITWIDGVRYDKSSSSTTPVYGGNWRVTAPEAVNGIYVAECRTTLFGMGQAHYYGEINVIQ